MNLRTILTGLIGMLLSSLLIVTVASSQEEKNENAFDTMIDSIVENAFSNFDEKFDTYIFTKEPDTFDNEDYDWSFERNYARRNRHNNSALYVGSTDSRLSKGPSRSYPWESNDGNLLFRYNRVEGPFLGLNYPNTYTWDHRSISLFGSGGYGFATHRWRYAGGVSQQFGMGRSLLEFGVEGHSLTDTKDQWLLDEGENTLSALVTRNDYRDYFGRQGISGWVGVFGKWNSSDMQIRAAYLNDEYSSLEWRTNWAMFGGDHSFRENPQIWEGRMRSVLASFEMHQERQRAYFTSGWKTALSAEIAGKSFGGDFEFNRYIIDVVRYQPLTRLENINFRFRIASATGDVPPQKWFELGGISTLPAFTYKEFSGNRMALFNAEYLLNGKIFDDVDIFPSWLLRNCNMILFYDAGYASTASPDERPDRGFEDFTLNSVKSDWGVGLGTRDAKLRIGFTWRTDVSEPVRVFLRLSRPF